MLKREEILSIMTRLNEKLRAIEVKGELYLLGGAVMCLAFRARAATKDLDAVFEPKNAIRQAAQEIAAEYGLDSDWLNDSVKGFLSDNASFENFLDLSHLKVYTASAEYLLAMKCLSMRIGKEFHDENDVRFLLRYLNIENYDRALSVIGRYYELKLLPQKTLYALEEILTGKITAIP